MAEFIPYWVKDKPKQEHEFKSNYANSSTFGHRLYDRYALDERNESNGFRRIRAVTIHKDCQAKGDEVRE